MITDVTPATYKHRCEACGQEAEYHHSKLRHGEHHGDHALAHDCACGVTEHFNTALAQDDEYSPTRTEESRTHCKAIRALQRHLGLPVK